MCYCFKIENFCVVGQIKQAAQFFLQNHADKSKRDKDLWDGDSKRHHCPLSHQDDPLRVQVLGESTGVQSRQVSHDTLTFRIK